MLRYFTSSRGRKNFDVKSTWAVRFWRWRSKMRNFGIIKTNKNKCKIFNFLKRKKIWLEQVLNLKSSLNISWNEQFLWISTWASLIQKAIMKNFFKSKSLMPNKSQHQKLLTKCFIKQFPASQQKFFLSNR